VPVTDSISCCCVACCNHLCFVLPLQTGLAGVTHIGIDKDYSPVIKAALASEGWTEGEQVVSSVGLYVVLIVAVISSCRCVTCVKAI
jgi:hypothetical protein